MLEGITKSCTINRAVERLFCPIPLYVQDMLKGFWFNYVTEPKTEYTVGVP